MSRKAQKREEQRMPDKVFKYVMIDYINPILFTNTDHKALRTAGNITSAGFIALLGGKVTTEGESFSLGLKPAPDDAEIIERYMVQGGLL
jgi:hypothetical protein